MIEENDSLKEENNTSKDEKDALAEETKRLRQDNTQSKKQIIDLQQKIKNDKEERHNMKLVQGKKGPGKNTVKLGDMLLKQCPQNLVVYGNISTLISNNILRRFEFMPKGWELWSGTKKCDVLVYLQEHSILHRSYEMRR